MELIAIGWIACGIGAAGLNFAYFQGKYPSLAEENWREDLGECLLMGLIFGPIALLGSLACSGFGKYGWRLWRR